MGDAHAGQVGTTSPATVKAVSGTPPRYSKQPASVVMVKSAPRLSAKQTKQTLVQAITTQKANRGPIESRPSQRPTSAVTGNVEGARPPL